MCTVIRRGTRCLLTLSHKLPTCLNRDDTASQVVHQIINTGNTTMRYLALAINSDPEICEYPDSNKMGVYVSAPETRVDKTVGWRRLGSPDAQRLASPEPWQVDQPG